jgi:PKD domain
VRFRSGPFLALLAATSAALCAPSAEARTATRVLHVGARTLYLSRHGDTFPHGAPIRAGVARAAAAADTGDLAPTWCGAERATDDTTDGLDPVLPQVKVVYARPSDVPDHLLSGSDGSRLADKIQQDVRADTSLVALASGGEKTIRFDVGSTCGIRYVDIVSVVLPRTTAQYGSDPNEVADRVEADLAGLRRGFGPGCVTPGAARCPRNFAIYLDGVSLGGVKGIGDRFEDDTPGPSNASNLGGLSAIIFDPLGNDFRTVSLLHETSHTLGAVQDGTALVHAPHASGNGHCWDERDVMCYQDDGPYQPIGGPQTLCDTEVELYDCGGDDYFSTHPAPGSYLAAHWNVANSVFMCVLAACTIPAENTAPHAAFTVTRTAGRGLLLDGTGSGDAQGGVTYAWDLDGDGRTDARTATVRRTLRRTPARYAFRLTVTDGGGLSGTVTHGLTVGHPPAVGTALTRALRAEAARVARERLAGVRAQPRLRLRFAAATPGRLVFTVRAGRSVLATGARAFSRAGTATLVVPLLARAGGYVARRSLRLTLSAAFRPRGASAVRRSRALSLGL